MKIKIPGILLISLLIFSSCKENEAEIQQAEEKVPVTFTMGDLEVSEGDFKSNNSTFSGGVKDKIDFLSCRVYNAVTGNQITTIHQKKTDPDFGTIKLDLPVGTYSGAFVGSQAEIDWNFQPSIGTDYFYNVGGKVADTFFKLEREIKVESGTNKLIKLSRIIGGLEIILDDAIPAEVDKLNVIVRNEASYYKVNDGYFGSSIDNVRSVGFDLVAADIGKTGKIFSMFVKPTESGQGQVTLIAYDSKGTPMYQKVIRDVPFLMNKKTTLKGRLFANSSPFKITIDGTWGDPQPPFSIP